jgi:hypothetical protein
MADIDLKTETPDASLPADGFLFGADSQAAASPSVYTTQSVATRLLGSTTLSGTTITANAPVLDLAQTWNNAAVTFTGAKLNVTDTASNAASLLMDLQVGGTSVASFSKTGTLFLRASATKAGTINFGVNMELRRENTSSGVLQFRDIGSTYIELSTSGVKLTDNSGVFSWNDLILGRRAAANLRLGAADAAAPVAQTLSVQSGTAGASATTVSISGTSLTIAGTITGTIAIGHAVTGTGVSAGTLITAGSGTSWTVNNSQTVGPITAYFNSVGRDLTIAGSQGSGPSAGGSIVFQVAPAGSAATTAQNALATFAEITSARTLNLYNTFTASDNFERLRIVAQSGGSVIIGTQKGTAGGTARALELQTDGTTRLTIATTGAATFAGNIENPVSITGSAITFNGLFLQNTSLASTASTGFTAQNNQTAQLLMRVYGSGVTDVSVWGTTLANYAGLLTDGASSNGLLIGTVTADPVIFGTDTSEKMRITSGGLITFGGTTSSFPALKRSSTTLQARLADDSGFASMQGKLTTETAYTAGAPTATGYLVLYDSNGTAYKVPAEAL